MKVVLTEKQAITSKKGDEWVKLSYLTAKGKAGELFLSKAEAETYGVSDEVLASDEDIKELFESSPKVSVEFNERGRVVGIEV